MSETLHPTAESEPQSTHANWDDLKNVPFGGEKTPDTSPKDFFENKYLHNLENSGVHFEPSSRQFESDHSNTIIENIKNVTEIYGYNAMFSAIGELSGNTEYTTEEQNIELAEATYDFLDTKANEARLNADDEDILKYNMLSDTLSSIESTIFGNEDGSMQTLDSAAQNLLLQKNRQYLAQLRDGRVNEQIDQKYALDIALITEIRGILRRIGDTATDEAEMEQELIPTGESAREEQVKQRQEQWDQQRQEQLAREERIKRYAIENQRKKQQEREELRRKAISQSQKAQTQQQVNSPNAQQKTPQENEDEQEQEMGM